MLNYGLNAGNVYHHRTNIIFIAKLQEVRNQLYFLVLRFCQHVLNAKPGLLAPSLRIPQGSCKKRMLTSLKLTKLLRPFSVGRQLTKICALHAFFSFLLP